MVSVCQQKYRERQTFPWESLSNTFTTTWPWPTKLLSKSGRFLLWKYMRQRFTQSDLGLPPPTCMLTLRYVNAYSLIIRPDITATFVEVHIWIQSVSLHYKPYVQCVNSCSELFYWPQVNTTLCTLQFSRWATDWASWRGPFRFSGDCSTQSVKLHKSNIFNPRVLTTFKSCGS